ncbi:MAG: hypothetical protein RIS47_2300 [Bacteroidota bacterium]|jgi:regulator of sirC expression with transglutaminase-like and TPR domain
MPTQSEIQALITLLQDPDPNIQSVVRKVIIEHGKTVIPALETAWEHSPSENFQHDIEEIVHTINFESLKRSLHVWLAKQEHQILEGLILVAQYAFPELNINEIQGQIDALTQQIQSELYKEATPLEKIKIMNHVFFEKHGFTQNSNNFYAPQNSYINYVLDNRRGNPISLALIYLIVGRSLGLPLYGVNLPKNFILMYQDESKPQDFAIENVLFYINPYNKGAVLSAKEIEFFTRQQRLTFREEYYLACTNPVIVRRLLQNLHYAYTQIKDDTKAEEVATLRDILDNFLENDNGLLKP